MKRAANPSSVLAPLLLLVVFVLGSLVGCSPQSQRPGKPLSPVQGSTSTQQKSDTASARELLSAQQSEKRAESEPRADVAARAWLNCAAAAYRALDAQEASFDLKASELSNRCTGKVIDFALASEPQRWQPGVTRIGDIDVRIEFRDVSPSLSGPLQLVRADAIPMGSRVGARFAEPGFGLSLVAHTPRCSDRPICRLYPPEGIYRPVTAWIESTGPSSQGQAGAGENSIHLVLTDPVVHPSIAIGNHTYPLSIDTSALYAQLIDESPLHRLGVEGLVGGREIGRREGLYLLQDYDPGKTPIIMIHGLGSSPLIWARLTNRILASADLRARYQVWHVVYQTNTPVLLNRWIIQHLLDTAWASLDPKGNDPSRKGLVLIGHSMGGMISRMLCEYSTDAIWQAAFTVPPEALHGNASDLAALRQIFSFQPYPGVSKAIFLATPHAGSPLSDHFLGHLALLLVRANTPELKALQRIAMANPDGVRKDVLGGYRGEELTSISTLRAEEPVTHAEQSLVPAAGIDYYTIAGSLPGLQEPGDGIVPLKSAIIPGAKATFIVDSGHQVQDNEEAIADILGILRDHR
jgi:pimeloyl-ACP methyl ester carboxylesterase